jgi:hypothetical protein
MKHISIFFICATLLFMVSTSVGGILKVHRLKKRQNALSFAAIIPSIAPEFGAASAGMLHYQNKTEIKLTS